MKLDIDCPRTRHCSSTERSEKGQFCYYLVKRQDWVSFVQRVLAVSCLQCSYTLNRGWQLFWKIWPSWCNLHMFLIWVD